MKKDEKYLPLDAHGNFEKYIKNNYKLTKDQYIALHSISTDIHCEKPQLLLYKLNDEKYNEVIKIYEKIKKINEGYYFNEYEDYRNRLL